MKSDHRGLRAAALAAVVLAALGGAAGSAAHSQGDHEQARRALEQGQVLPLRSVLEKVEREHQGQVLKIEFEREDDRFVYKIRLLRKDGQLLGLLVDAVDGRVLGVKRRDGTKEDDAHPGRGR